MLTYQVRGRVYRLIGEEKSLPPFPNSVELVFFFQPLQSFGAMPGGGRTAVRGVAATAHFNGNSGHHFVESQTPLKVLEVIIEEPVRYVELYGNKLRISTQCESAKELDDLIQSVYFGFPILLNIEFADPPVVEKVEGKIGNVPFRWELKDWKMEFCTTTQELQEQRVASSWSRFDLLSQPGSRRFIAALHYFHVACRLCRAGNAPWEFMSEAILNLSKVLEVLFPPAGDGRTLDAAREGLRKLGYSESEIERDFIPAMCLRNHIDSAHVHLSVFTQRQLRVLHAYTDSAESVFRSMLVKLIEQMQENQYDLAQHTDLSASQEAIDIIGRLAQHFPEGGAG